MTSTKKRYSGIQTILGACGEGGCHFLTLCSIAEETNEEPVDLIYAIRLALDNKLMNKEFYVTDNCALLMCLTGKTWTQTEVKELPEIINDNEYTEAIYFNPRTQFKHFRRRGFDTLVDSVTVKEGNVIAYRIYKWS